MVNDTHLITAGDKVTASQAALLQKLDICPFSYGIGLKMVYDNGSLFDAKVLEITDDVLAGQFCEALGVLASISLAAGYPTQASVPHSIVNAFKMVLSVTIECGSYTFDEADMYEEYLKDPSKFASAGGGGGGAAAEEAAPVEEEEEEEAEAPAGGGGLFGDDGDGGDY
jgi:large subunit ribosomal protein LP0